MKYEVVRQSTPVPNFLIDEVMPTLRDTEWRVLTVVTRSTLGWVDEHGRRKRTGWLTHRYLRRRTGRSSGAICQAISALVKKRLLEVTDADGQFLPTAQIRRRTRGRLYYGVHPNLLEHLLAM